MKGMDTEDKFIDVWDKHVAPSLNATTGHYESSGNPTVSTTGTSISTSSQTSISRKRATPEHCPPALLPKKVHKLKKSNPTQSDAGNNTPNHWTTRSKRDLLV